MANLIIGIAFSEGSATRAINGLCDRFGLERTEANAKAALKRLAILTIREQEQVAAQREAEAKPEPA